MNFRLVVKRKFINTLSNNWKERTYVFWDDWRCTEMRKISIAVTCSFVYTFPKARLRILQIVNFRLNRIRQESRLLSSRTGSAALPCCAMIRTWLKGGVDNLRTKYSPWTRQNLVYQIKKTSSFVRHHVNSWHARKLSTYRIRSLSHFIIWD